VSYISIESFATDPRCPGLKVGAYAIGADFAGAAGAAAPAIPELGVFMYFSPGAF